MLTPEQLDELATTTARKVIALTAGHNELVAKLEGALGELGRRIDALERSVRDTHGQLDALVTQGITERAGLRHDVDRLETQSLTTRALPGALIELGQRLDELATRTGVLETESALPFLRPAYPSAQVCPKCGHIAHFPNTCGHPFTAGPAADACDCREGTS